MLEKKIEQKLVKAVKQEGGICPKFVSPGMDGMPDRLILMPGGRMAFVELKAPGKKPRPLQIHRHRQLQKLGFDTFVLDRAEDIPCLMAIFDILVDPKMCTYCNRPTLAADARSDGIPAQPESFAKSTLSEDSTL